MKQIDPVEDPICPWLQQNSNQYETLLSKHQKYIKGSKSLKKYASLNNNVQENMKKQSEERNQRSLMLEKSSKRADCKGKQSILKVRRKNEEKIEKVEKVCIRKKEKKMGILQTISYKDPSFQKLIEIVQTSEYGELFKREVLYQKIINKNPGRYFGKKEPKNNQGQIGDNKIEYQEKLLPKISQSCSFLPYKQEGLKVLMKRKNNSDRETYQDKRRSGGGQK